ncbi:hypothetical protein Mal52_28240 [Symmachiella dynata]|uniref:Uncharacterized protein n=1 Tax=Symmachiella dynata TaxID=2527995 RepID=A0A517ZPD3_9PLAN|nr:hypothetical protein Mal52_28240 [Symmachiella dynata]
MRFLDDPRLFRGPENLDSAGNHCFTAAKVLATPPFDPVK